MLDVVDRHVRERLDLKYGPPSEDRLKVLDPTDAYEELRYELTTYEFEVLTLTPVFRCFRIQSRISYMVDHRFSVVANLTIRMLERVPLQPPIEWITLCRNLSKAQNAIFPFTRLIDTTKHIIYWNASYFTDRCISRLT
jgi:hypothetical protein